MTAMKKKISPKLPHYSFHHLIKELSFWGTTTRVLLIAFIAFAVSVLQILDAQLSVNTSLLQSIITEGQLFVYIVATFLILDVGYIIIARNHRLPQIVDSVGLLSIEAVLALSYFLPYFAIVSDTFTSASRWTFVAALFVLAVRLLVGVLYGTPAKK